VPVLFVSGGLDPVTPPSFAQEIRRTLPNSAQVLVRSGGHNLYDLSDPECLDHLEQQFIDRGTLAGLDTNCAAKMTRPGFAFR
jgi:pimeloyl-ACP methyl ester carboxylesterase